MKINGILSLTAISEPKIKVSAFKGLTKAKVEIELYDVDLNWLANLAGKRLWVEMEEQSGE